MTRVMFKESLNNSAQIIFANGSVSQYSTPAPLATCERIDECKDWADKMAAMASYAKQSQDDALEKAATKIRARAIRRCGELLEGLKQKEKDRVANIKKSEVSQGGGVPTLGSAKAAARAAGLSREQQINAQRVARIPEKDFEAALESDDPPTVTELAARARRARSEVCATVARTSESFKESDRRLLGRCSCHP